MSKETIETENAVVESAKQEVDKGELLYGYIKRFTKDLHVIVEKYLQDNMEEFDEIFKDNDVFSAFVFSLGATLPFKVVDFGDEKESLISVNHKLNSLMFDFWPILVEGDRKQAIELQKAKEEEAKKAEEE